MSKIRSAARKAFNVIRSPEVQVGCSVTLLGCAVIFALTAVPPLAAVAVAVSAAYGLEDNISKLEAKKAARKAKKNGPTA